MSQPPISAFEIGQGISKQISGASSAYQERSALDQILGEALKSNDPNAVNKAIGQIASRVSPEKQPMAMKVLENKLSEIKSIEQGKLDEQLGLPEGFSPASHAQQQGWLQMNKPKVDKAAEAKEAKEGAVDIVNRMKEIRAGGRLGLMSRIKPSAATRKDRGEYEQLGKALIGFATKMPGGIRNQREFEALATKLYDPNMTDAAAAGLLDAMEMMLSGKVKSVDEATAPKEVPTPEKSNSSKNGKTASKKQTQKTRKPLRSIW